MRYDKNYAYFGGHPEWFDLVVGVGYVPTDKAPEEAVKAMEEYNSYTFKTSDKDKSTEEKYDSMQIWCRLELCIP